MLVEKAISTSGYSCVPFTSQSQGMANRSSRSLGAVHSNSISFSQPSAVSSHDSDTLAPAPSTSVAPLKNVVSPRRSLCPSRKTHRKGSEKV
jgi:hypothetical protein